MLGQIMRGLDAAAVQKLIGSGSALKAFAEGRVVNCTLLSDIALTAGNQEYRFVRAAPGCQITSDEALNALKSQGLIRANLRDFQDLLDSVLGRMNLNTAVMEQGLTFVLLGERAETCSTVSGTFSGTSVTCFGRLEYSQGEEDQSIKDDGPQADFYPENPAASWDSSYLFVGVRCTSF
jgi:hypothetical protein